MARCTNELLEKINKRNMIDTVMSLQNKLDGATKHVVEKILKLSMLF